ncbi:MAG: hypothetical protein LVQ95_01890 [Candidatus Micrarchaeales archaeon]|nr:hypothetical protein [Candidatus Micrarchaeales archaeon]
MMGSQALLELKERYKVKPEDFETRLDLLCYLIALQITATDKDFFMPISGKPQMGKSTLAIQTAIKTIEFLQKEFNVNIPQFDFKNDIKYPPMSEDAVLKIMDIEKPPIMMFDRVVFSDETLRGIGFEEGEVEEIREGTCVYFSNMKTRVKGYNKFEGEVSAVLQKAFIYDILFTNPRMAGKEYKEYCDILINFFDSCVISQCKECNIKDPERLRKATIVDGLIQLKTSVNRARARSVKLFMVNSVKIFKEYSFLEEVNIYPLLIVNQKEPFLDYESLKGLYPELNKLDFIPIILTLDDLKFLVSELDTPSDLFVYFKKREEMIKAGKLLFQDEIELLSYYLLNMKSFEPELVGTRSGILTGFYEEYKKGRYSELFIKKRELDKVSYWVDDVIKGATMLSHSQPDYLKGLEEVLKLNRVQRRHLAGRAEEKRKKAIERKGDAWGMAIYPEKPDIGFVLYFTPEFTEETYPYFNSMCACAEYKANVKKIVGLAETTSEDKPKFRMEIYFEKYENAPPPTPEEEDALKRLCEGFWGEVSNSSYGEFS